ncbi:DUF1775 domain-containing protein [Microbacterium terricola]|uniref:YncI copper-binding domain-containing protein n=1 Tax=Microbacterium terricola TaxID=344163 RepID=A0ABM8DX57_9MICO|nr:DUF1775 domain-containing protein [Microbacterium terricola]UYK39108.1 DUF1775 domain-containing protein [Microbacterium terricola]BDV30181.1 hypothetical protein Microterr_08410 [Microbacterium terricola]
MTPRTTARSGARTARTLTGVTLGLAFAVAVPLAASAHVHVTPEEAAAGTTTRLSFSFSHGCDDSPTTAVVIDIPDGVATATPVLDGAWTISRELRADGTAAQVTFTADEPVETGVAAAVSLDALIAEGAADSTLVFPVTQECVDGETAWTEVAADDQDPEELESPAPLLTVGAVAETGDAHGHGGSASEESGEHEHAAAAESTDAVTADPVARWLAAGGLAAGVAALVVALVRRRRA